MGIDLQRLRADTRRFKSTRARSPIGKPKTGATEVLRTHYAEINRMHSEGVQWTEIAAALADQGVTQGDGEPITGRRLTALMRNIARQIERSVTAKSNRMSRKDLAISPFNRDENQKTKLALAPEITNRASAHSVECLSEGDIRRNALERHSHLLNRQ